MQPYSNPLIGANSFKDQEMIWGPSAAMQSLRRVVSETAVKDIPILIIGESGTGKGLLALQIHRLSKHSQDSFTRVSCRSFLIDNVATENLRRGAQTILRSRGTVFLDNLFESELDSQRWLLDLMPEEGGLSNGSCETRMISATRATRATLYEELRAGRFLQDLYFRLNGVSIHVPPLRERKEDLPELTNILLEKYGASFDRPRPKLGDEVFERLANYSWPGNVRQLENTVKRIVATGDVDSALDDLVEIAQPRPNLNATEHSSLKKAVREARREIERQLIARALNRTRWNRKRAAQELQISYKSLLSKLRQMSPEADQR